MQLTLFHTPCLITDVLPNNFEGAKLLINKCISNHFQVSHTINMTSFSPPGYRFGATYVGCKQYSPNEAYPILVGDMDPSGNLNATILHQFTQNIRTKCAAQVNWHYINFFLTSLLKEHFKTFFLLFYFLFAGDE